MTPLQLTRRRPELVAALLIAAGVAWWWTTSRMAGMDAGPGTDLGALGWFTGSWVLMMAAMMLPSFTPTLAAYSARTPSRISGQTLLFAIGYLLVWAGAGLAVYGIFELGKALLGTELAWHRGGRWLAAGVVASAAVYELIPLKQKCLSRCRGQLRDDRTSALLMGIRSGGWCIGCSWALMAALFALGVMSVTWMIVIAALVAVEKLGPWPRGARVMTAALLAALAVGIAAAPHDVPGLHVPASGPMHAMKSMS